MRKKYPQQPYQLFFVEIPSSKQDIEDIEVTQLEDTTAPENGGLSTEQVSQLAQDSLSFDQIRPADPEDKDPQNLLLELED